MEKSKLYIQDHLIILFVNFYGCRVDERILIFGGTFMMVAFWFITFPWPGLPDIEDESDLGAILEPCCSYLNNVCIRFILVGDTIPANVNTTIDSHAMDSGCNSHKYYWCKGITKEPIGLYLGTFFLLACGFPLANCAQSALFSKILGPRRQVRKS